ncbi:lysM domain receptor-like kinase 3 isoform X2 [Mangifera indica]|uniref:lysM domain receptor-like kinase 3 isoform X2 n=1 Tax=Mangifera indica TaxID=29780 RepID=UPI001CFA03BA|nr:lysM domain receptor-like kinase 3 isoform X2 [Mangifera indica]
MGEVSSKFGSFVLEKKDKTLIPTQIVTLDLLCSCSKSFDYVLTYKVESGDTRFTICSRFQADLDKTAMFNRLENPNLIYAGDVIFIPGPGLQNFTRLEDKDPIVKETSKSQILIVVGSTLAAFTFILLTVALLFLKYYKRMGTPQSKVYPGRLNSLCCYLGSSQFHTKFKESAISSFSSEKATVFPYHEVCDATSNFSTSLKIGQGSYGSVYLGKLRGIDVAIKQMKNTKSKEFLSDLNILCKVHHSNLIELIGYAAGGDSLFLIYEYAQNGALSDHLHRPSIRGYKPLAWTTRVQIALDAAKGLEYIHEYRKPYYVHRDVKTSNILLDSNFRAKIADFGLVKLLEHSPEVAAVASRIVGAFGYLAPEYVRDGCVTTKSEVYSFGVVVMELITGQQALSKEASPGNDQYTEHRSLVDHNPMDKLLECLDPNLTQYHRDLVFQMALLAKDCVDDNWRRRPDMSNVVISLSSILNSSKANTYYVRTLIHA